MGASMCGRQLSNKQLGNLPFMNEQGNASSGMQSKHDGYIINGKRIKPIRIMSLSPLNSPQVSQSQINSSLQESIGISSGNPQTSFANQVRNQRAISQDGAFQISGGGELASSQPVRTEEIENRQNTMGVINRHSNGQLVTVEEFDQNTTPISPPSHKGQPNLQIQHQPTEGSNQSRGRVNRTQLLVASLNNQRQIHPGSIDRRGLSSSQRFQSQAIAQGSSPALLSSPTLQPHHSRYLQRGGLQPLQNSKFQRNMTHKNYHANTYIESESHQNSPRSRGSISNHQRETFQSFHQAHNQTNDQLRASQINDNASFKQSEIISQSSQGIHDLNRMNSSVQNIMRGPGQNSSFSSMPGSPEVVSVGSFRRKESGFKKQQSGVAFIKLQNTMNSIGMNTPLFHGEPIQETERSSIHSSEIEDGSESKMRKDKSEESKRNKISKQIQRQTSIFGFRKHLSGFQSYVTKNLDAEEKKESMLETSSQLINESALKTKRQEGSDVIMVSVERFETSDQEEVKGLQKKNDSEALQNRSSERSRERNSSRIVMSDGRKMVDKYKSQDISQKHKEERDKLREESKIGDFESKGSSNVLSLKQKRKVNISKIMIQDVDQHEVANQNGQELFSSYSLISKASIRNNSEGSIKNSNPQIEIVVQPSSQKRRSYLEKNSDVASHARRFSKSASMDIVEKFLQDQQNKNTFSQQDKVLSDSSSVVNLKQLDSKNPNSIFKDKRSSHLLSHLYNSQRNNQQPNFLRKSHTFTEIKRKKPTKFNKTDRENLQILEKIYDQILRQNYQSQHSSNSSFNGKGIFSQLEQSIQNNTPKKSSQGHGYLRMDSLLYQSSSQMMIQNQQHASAGNISSLGNSPIPHKKLSSSNLVNKDLSGLENIGNLSQKNGANYSVSSSKKQEGNSRGGGATNLLDVMRVEKQFSFKQDSLLADSRNSEEQFTSQEDSRKEIQTQQSSALEKAHTQNEIKIHVYEANDDDENSLTQVHQRYNSHQENQNQRESSELAKDIMLNPSVMIHCNTIVELPEEDYKSSIGISDKNSFNHQKSNQTHQTPKSFFHPQTNQSKNLTHKQITFNSGSGQSIEQSGGQQSVKIYDLVPKNKLIKIFRRVSERIESNDGLIERLQQLQRDNTIDKGNNQATNILAQSYTQPSDSSSANFAGNISKFKRTFNSNSNNGISKIRSHDSLQDYDQHSLKLSSEKTEKNPKLSEVIENFDALGLKYDDQLQSSLSQTQESPINTYDNKFDIHHQINTSKISQLQVMQSNQANHHPNSQNQGKNSQLQQQNQQQQSFYQKQITTTFNPIAVAAGISMSALMRSKTKMRMTSKFNDLDEAEKLSSSSSDSSQSLSDLEREEEKEAEIAIQSLQVNQIALPKTTPTSPMQVQQKQAASKFNIFGIGPQGTAQTPKVYNLADAAKRLMKLKDETAKIKEESSKTEDESIIIEIQPLSTGIKKEVNNSNNMFIRQSTQIQRIQRDKIQILEPEGNQWGKHQTGTMDQTMIREVKDALSSGLQQLEIIKQQSNSSRKRGQNLSLSLNKAGRNDIPRIRDGSMIVDTQKLGKSNSRQGRNLIKSVKFLARSTDNLEKLPILAQEARLNNLKNLLIKQFGDKIPKSNPKPISINQQKRTVYRNRRRTAFTNSHHSIADSQSESYFKNFRQSSENNQILEQSDSRLKISFLNNNFNVIPHNGMINDFSPLSYTTPKDFAEGFHVLRRTQSFTSSNQTPDTSVKFGLRDFNPGDFTYELQNIVRVSGDTIYEPSLLSSRSRDLYQSSFDYYNTLNNQNFSPKGKIVYGSLLRNGPLSRGGQTQNGIYIPAPSISPFVPGDFSNNHARNNSAIYGKMDASQFYQQQQSQGGNLLSSYNSSNYHSHQMSNSAKIMKKSSFNRHLRKQSLPPQSRQRSSALGSEQTLQIHSHELLEFLQQKLGFGQKQNYESPSDTSKRDEDTIKTKVLKLNKLESIQKESNMLHQFGGEDRHPKQIYSDLSNTYLDEKTLDSNTLIDFQTQQNLPLTHNFSNLGEENNGHLRPGDRNEEPQYTEVIQSPLLIPESSDSNYLKVEKIVRQDDSDLGVVSSPTGGMEIGVRIEMEEKKEQEYTATRVKESEEKLDEEESKKLKNSIGAQFSNLLIRPNNRSRFLTKQPSNLTAANLKQLEKDKQDQQAKEIDLSPMGRNFSQRRKVVIPTNKTAKSITTISAISTKVNGKTCINQYLCIQQIGQGKFAKVVMCIDQTDQKPYAMKIMDKKKLKRIFISRNKHAYDAVETEMAVLKKLDHPNVVRLYEIIDDPKHDKLYLVTDLIKNGTLQKLLSTKDLNEAEMRKLFKQLIIAVEYCHECAHIIHRDIKPENILLDENNDVKLSDFGVSFMMENATDDSLSNSQGSYYYFSPEACIGSTYKGKKSDIWACGITLYFMVFKKHPFVSTVIPDLFRRIQSQDVPWPSEIEPRLKDLISKMLIKNPEFRLSINEIKKHRWVTNDGQEPMADIEYQEIAITDEDKVNAFSRLKVFADVIVKKLDDMRRTDQLKQQFTQKMREQMKRIIVQNLEDQMAKSQE